MSIIGLFTLYFVVCIYKNTRHNLFSTHIFTCYGAMPHSQLSDAGISSRLGESSRILSMFSLFLVRNVKNLLSGREIGIDYSLQPKKLLANFYSQELFYKKFRPSTLIVLQFFVTQNRRLYIVARCFGNHKRIIRFGGFCFKVCD